MSEKTGLTRRDLLKRGGLIGAVAWATPVVQVVGMRPAHAMFTSPGPCKTYCIKWETDRNYPALDGADEVTCGDISYPILGNVWTGLGDGKGNCLICPDGSMNSTPPDIGQFVVYGDPEDTIWVSFPEKYNLVPAWYDGSPVGGFDPPPNTGGAAKCGQFCEPVLIGEPLLGGDVEDPDPCSYPGDVQIRRRVAVGACPKPNGNGNFEISHIELIVQDCT